MLERFEKLSIPVSFVALTLPNAPDMILSSDLRIIQDSLDVLMPFLLTTTELSSDSKTTLSKVIPICHMLKTAIDSTQPQTDWFEAAAICFKMLQSEAR